MCSFRRAASDDKSRYIICLKMQPRRRNYFYFAPDCEVRVAHPAPDLPETRVRRIGWEVKVHNCRLPSGNLRGALRLFAVYVARTRIVDVSRARGGLTRAPRTVTKTHFLRNHNSPSPVGIQKALLLLSTNSVPTRPAGARLRVEVR